MTLKDWPADDRPREKLLAKGADAFSEAELLAIFLRSGVAGKSAVELGQDLIRHFGGLPGLFAAAPQALDAFKGLGQGETVQLRATREIVRRLLASEMASRDALSSPVAVREHLRLTLQGLEHEVFMALLRDAQNRVIRSEELFRGTLTQTSVHPREVVKRALRHNAAGVIFAHFAAGRKMAIMWRKSFCGPAPSSCGWREGICQSTVHSDGVGSRILPARQLQIGDCMVSSAGPAWGALGRGRGAGRQCSQ